MRLRRGLGIAERLALGFGTAGLLLVLLVGAAHHWTGRVEALREQQNQVIAPRAASADRLETAVLYLGIASRNYVLVPDAHHLEEFEAAAARVREEARVLQELPKPAADRAMLANLPLLVERFDDGAHALGEATRRHEPIATLEADVATAREALLSVVRAYAVRQRDLVEETRQAVTDAVEAADRAGLILGGLLLAVLVITAVVTTRSVRRPARALVASAQRVGEGDFDPAIDAGAGAARDGDGSPRDELAGLAQAIGTMARALRTREKRLRASAALSAALAESLDVGRLCASGLQVIVDHLGVECGAVYLAGEGGALRLVHRLGLGGEEALAPGHGVPGRAAAERRAVVVTDLPADTEFTIRLGVDRLPPRAVVAAPMVVQGDAVVGVLVIAAARPIAADAVEFLERAAAQLGVSLQNAAGHAQIERLVRELQDGNERLQAQQEELQAQQEELQSQNEELQAQQEELQSQNEELQAQGDELRRAEEELRRADRNKSEFLAVLSHELRNPLAPIQNSLHVLDRAAPGSEQARRAHAVVTRQVRQLTRLVEDLLDVTRISNGKVRLRRTPLDLSRLVRQLGEDVAAEFAERGLSLSVEAPGALRVDGDPARLSQIVGNLLQNAAKFTPRGGSVRVALDEVDGRARLRVRDTGAGMGEETLRRLFQPFVQADATLARTDGGLGLGLALVKGLVELHDGAVRAESDGPGMGAEFVVELPLDRVGVPAPAPGAAPLGPRRRVLVIEDNVDAADSLRDALALAGHDVEVAYRGADGVARARAFRPDAVLCDIGLPDMDGLAVARALREEPTARAALLVALSGYALPDDERRAREAGFDAHLAKPPSLDRLGELLTALGERAREAG